MTRDELKQKLDAVKCTNARQHRAVYDGIIYSTGFEQLLPLLLDAYEALSNLHNKSYTAAHDRKMSDVDWNKLMHRTDCAEIVLARIEAFANGEK